MGQITDSRSQNLLPVGPFLGSYLVRAEWRHTATGTPIPWAMQILPTANRVIRLKKIYGIISFDGTAAAATTTGWQWALENWKDVMAAGTQLFPVRKRNRYGASCATVRFIDTGITAGTTQAAAGPGNVGPIEAIEIPLSVTNKRMPYEIVCSGDGRDFKNDDIVMYPGCVLTCTVIAGGAVVGLTHTGCVEYDEYELNGFNKCI
jgi:hypothetical protein